MTPEQQSFFREKGYLLLKRALGKHQVGPIKAHALDELKRLKLWSSGKTLSASIKEMPAFQQVAKLSGSIKLDGRHSKVVETGAQSSIASLAGTRLVPAQGQFLISLPRQGEWTLDGLAWHTDLASTGHYHLPGVQAFVLIDDVAPRGGATLAVAGSHLLAGQEGPSRRVREILRGGGDLEGGLRRVNLSIMEMSGQAGDIYLMDMRLLHSPSINSTDKVRIMATMRYLPVARGAMG